MTCDYCGKTQEKQVFFIGASHMTDLAWTMHEGSGKMSCEDRICWAKGTDEGQNRIRKALK